MVDYGLEMDNRRRRGWQACKVTPQPAYDVPIGVIRTQVKYTKARVYPNYNREFSVHRCNQANRLNIDQVCQKRKVL